MTKIPYDPADPDNILDEDGNVVISEVDGDEYRDNLQNR